MFFYPFLSKALQQKLNPTCWKIKVWISKAFSFKAKNVLGITAVQVLLKFYQQFLLNFIGKGVAVKNRRTICPWGKSGQLASLVEIKKCIEFEECYCKILEIEIEHCDSCTEDKKTHGNQHKWIRRGQVGSSRRSLSFDTLFPCPLIKMRESTNKILPHHYCM